MSASRKFATLITISQIVSILYSPNAIAQQESDPTRPPALDRRAVLAQAQPDSTGTGSGLILQSVLISPSGREVIISGKNLHEGQKIGNAIVAKIDEASVRLRGPAGVQVLQLFPGVDKRVVINRNLSDSGR